MSPVHVNLNAQQRRACLSDSDRIVASPDGNHFFTFSPAWNGPVPLPFRAAAAAITLTEKPDPRVLILGYGMGAVGALMSSHRPQARVTGVEPDQKLHQSASESIDSRSQVHLVDAVSFLQSRSDSQAKYDLVFDDCFIVTTDELDQEQPYRPLELEQIPALVKRHVRPGGVYARNLLDQDDLPLDQQRSTIRGSFEHTAERSYRDWDNVLLIASDHELDVALVATLGN